MLRCKVYAPIARAYVLCTADKSRSRFEIRTLGKTERNNIGKSAGSQSMLCKTGRGRLLMMMSTGGEKHVLSELLGRYLCKYPERLGTSKGIYALLPASLESTSFLSISLDSLLYSKKPPFV